MKKLELNKMENLQGGDFVTGVCSGLGIAGGVTAVGANAVALGIAATNFWNPAGWLAGAFAVAAIGCGSYVGYKALSN